jgi:hypothetical protein
MNYGWGVLSEEDLSVTKTIRRWRQVHRRHEIERQLKRLSLEELALLWITPAEVDHLAFEASQK